MIEEQATPDQARDDEPTLEERIEDLESQVANIRFGLLPAPQKIEVLRQLIAKDIEAGRMPNLTETIEQVITHLSESDDIDDYISSERAITWRDLMDQGVEPMEAWRQATDQWPFYGEMAAERRRLAESAVRALVQACGKGKS